jgi:F1F0 ATPase subunit 2
MDTTDIIFYSAAGSTLGALYFLLLAWTVRLHATGAAATFVIPFHVARSVAAVSTFWFIAQRGAFPLVLALLGFLIARTIVQHGMRLE